MSTPEIKTAGGRVFSLVVLYDTHTKLLHSSLQKISSEDVHNGDDTSANHIAWLSGSMVQDLQEMSVAFGSDLYPEAGEFSKDDNSAQAGVKPLSEFEMDLDASSPVLQEPNLDVAGEKPGCPFEMPDKAMSFFDLIAFILYREANTKGQIELWRKLLGCEAMKCG